ncbi:YhcN/YlaJ family sporulation lipoprotein [Paenalkalicoccus suaedae]|uniref:YhcN/YlaJ family sporulation lipoprotein n=1 Tax=Paenalkalicoccus suaedae TaxID=2592382 RepID=A0A859FDD6_9BACI|nr:YhcN/YlaJ family sporulation lipoprotein [Paenalkalicoccus suaedae]QKS70762.1 YhcN/YlaJ family sporulation lipoprotein [Paenalkalicoccus suaedae]
MKKSLLTLTCALTLTAGMTACGNMNQNGDEAAYHNPSHYGLDTQQASYSYPGQTTGMARGVTGNHREDMVDENGLLNGRLTGYDRPNGNGYYATGDGKLARELEKRVSREEGVADTDVLVRDNDILVGVNSTNNGIERRVESLAKPLAGNRNVHVVTEDNGFGRIHDMESRLRDGGAFDEIGSTFDAMLDDLGDAASRPFTRTR